MARTKEKVEATVSDTCKSQVKQMCDRLGLTEADYLRGALVARMRRDTRRIAQELELAQKSKQIEGNDRD